MNVKEIEKELQLNYVELCEYLQNKYGLAVVDYFPNPECKARNKRTSRTKEGLYCHHADEDKGGNLSNPPQARMQPYEWQKKERLVYCNAIEHLILHYKIAVLRQNKHVKSAMDVSNFFTTGGIYMVCHEINDMYMNDGTEVAWKQRCFAEIRDNFEDYIQLVKALIVYLDYDYQGDKREGRNYFVGANVPFSDCTGKIIAISEEGTHMHVKVQDEVLRLSYAIMIQQLTLIDILDIVHRRMATGFECFYSDIYERFMDCQINDTIQKYAKLLSVDYSDDRFIWGSEAYNN